MHKKTGELAIARGIWLECDFPPPHYNDYNIQFTVSSNAWAFENKFGMVFVLPPKAQDEFEDLGEL